MHINVVPRTQTPNKFARALHGSPKLVTIYCPEFGYLKGNHYLQPLVIQRVAELVSLVLTRVVFFHPSRSMKDRQLRLLLSSPSHLHPYILLTTVLPSSIGYAKRDHPQGVLCLPSACFYVAWSTFVFFGVLVKAFLPALPELIRKILHSPPSE